MEITFQLRQFCGINFESKCMKLIKFAFNKYFWNIFYANKFEKKNPQLFADEKIISEIKKMDK